MQKKPIPKNQYLRRIRRYYLIFEIFIDSIRKSYLFPQVEKQNYGVFWKIGVKWEF